MICGAHTDTLALSKALAQTVIMSKAQTVALVLPLAGLCKRVQAALKHWLSCSRLSQQSRGWVAHCLWRGTLMHI